MLTVINNKAPSQGPYCYQPISYHPKLTLSPHSIFPVFPNVSPGFPNVFSRPPNVKFPPANGPLPHRRPHTFLFPGPRHPLPAATIQRFQHNSSSLIFFPHYFQLLLLHFQQPALTLQLLLLFKRI